MAARKVETAAAVEELHTMDTAKQKIIEVIEAKAADMLKGPDRVNDPKIMEAMATLYTAIK